MNPRIQVEHTVTEQITGVDLGPGPRCLIAQGHSLTSRELGLPAPGQVPRNGFAIQCRVTTEDPGNKFMPDYGKILAYRSSGGFGLRLDGGMGYAGAVITPFYDSLLVKVISSGQTFDLACQRADRSLREFRIRGVKTNIPFLECHRARRFPRRIGDDHAHRHDPGPVHLQPAPQPSHQGPQLHQGNIIVNGNPHAKGYLPPRPLTSARLPQWDPRQSPPSGTRNSLLELGPKGFAEWTLKQKRLLLTDTTLRDAHQSLLATRVRTYDMLAAADALAHHVRTVLAGDVGRRHL